VGTYFVQGLSAFPSTHPLPRGGTDLTPKLAHYSHKLRKTRVVRSSIFSLFS